MKGYRRLTPRDRYQIEIFKSNNLSSKEIAARLRVSPSTICRELRLCSGPYLAEQAIKCAAKNVRKRSDSNRKISSGLKLKVDRLIRDDWSPEQIEDYLKKLNGVRSVSSKTIYRYIERDKLSGGRLKYHLRILRKKRKDRKMPKYRAYQGLVRDRTPISARPKVVEKRKRIGDYERDMVLGTVDSAALLTIVDRKTGYVHLACVKKRNAELVHRATVRLLKKKSVKTITNDNGTEFAFHRRTSRALNTKIYFSRSYAAWQRGTNENLNGLLRQYVPKQKPIPMLTSKELRKWELKLNTRPRKRLGFKTPHELYHGKTPGRRLQ